MASFRRDRISSLPNELLETIIQHIHEKCHLNAICRVSKQFHKLAVPLLYASLEIDLPECLELQSDALRPFSTSWPPIEFTSGLNHVRDLALTSSFFTIKYIGRRCWHDIDYDESGSDDSASPDVLCNLPALETDASHHSNEDAHEDGHDELPDNLHDAQYDSEEDTDYTEEARQSSQHEELFRKFCQGVSENSLRSFRWEVGACIPHVILSPDGYFTQNQTNLERLSLITDGTCDYTIGNQNKYDLSKFGMIRHFSWVGAQSFEDFRAIKQCFSTNARHLETLKLEIPDWETAFGWSRHHTRSTDINLEDSNLFVEEILSLASNDKHGSANTLFPVLHSLQLGLVSFNSGSALLADRFNMFKLKHLSLYFCPVVSRLLNYLTGSKEDLSLISFNLNCRDEYADSSEGVERAIIGFLQKVNGLQTLCLSLPAKILFANNIVEPICRYQKSLKRVALHSESGKLNLSTSIREFDEKWGYVHFSAAQFLFKKSTCEVIAVQSDPSWVLGDFKWHWTGVNCKLLHLRASANVVRERGRIGSEFRKELDDFADWVFGPKGFSQLLVLVYGDFAFHEECEGHNALYCRKNPGGLAETEPPRWEVLTSANKKLWNLVQDNMDLLSACPYMSIYPIDTRM